LDSTDRHGISAGRCNITETFRDGPVTRTPLIVTVPDVGFSSPATRRSRVDLPQPDLPMRVTNSLA
jgi:hypothetical protein